MNYVYFTLLGVASTYLLWILYICVMGFKRARNDGKLSKTALVLGYPVLVFGYLLDFLVNVVFMTPLLLDLPRELTVTARLKRHNSTSLIDDMTGFSAWQIVRAYYKNFMLPYRKFMVRWTKPLLDPFDPSGTHI